MAFDLLRDEDRSELEIRIPLSILRCLGLWPPRGPLRWYAFFVPLLLASKVITQMGLVIKNWGNLQHITMTLCIMITILSGIFKSTTFVLFRNRLNNLLDELAVCHNMYESARKRRHPALLKATAQRCLFMASSFLGLGGLALVLFVLHPALQDFLEVAPMDVSTNETRVRNMPSIAWYPFDHNVSPNYEAVYVYDSITLFTIYITTSTLDTFYVTIIIYISGQMKILNDNLLHLMVDAQDKLMNRQQVENDLDFAVKVLPTTQHSNNYFESKFITSELMDTELNVGIQQCINHHKAIIRAIRELEFVMSPACLTQFLTSMIVICLTAFVVTVTTGDMGQVATYVSYLLTMLYELALYCWYGNDIIEEGENVRLSVYGSGWPDASARVRSALKIIMEHARKELKLTGGKFYTLSRETFLTLVQGSYSYFAVLTQMNNSELPEAE